MGAVIDFHSHILPGIDDGSASLQESIELLRLEAAQGICHVLLTPHFYAMEDEPEGFLRRRAEAEALLREEMGRHDGLPRVSMGAEVSFFRGMSESEYLRRLTIAGGKCILIEMPPAPWPECVYRELEKIWLLQGIVPVLAHIDRYISPLRTYHIPARLAKLPVLVQANASFFLDRRTAGMAMRLLKADRIHILGSDCHNVMDRRPELGKALVRIRKKLGEKVISRICEYQDRILDVT